MTPTPAYLRCSLVVGAAVLIALVFGRPELVVVAVPFAVAMVWPRHAPTLAVHVESPVQRVRQGEVLALSVSVRAADPSSVGLIRARLVPVGLRGSGPLGWLADPDGTAHRVELRADRTGPREPGRVEVHGYDELLLARTPTTVVAAPSVRVLPRAGEVTVTEALPAAMAFAGDHLGRDAGPGVEFAGVRPFVAGDRPRQMSWRTTARTGVPHVATTFTDHSGRVCVLVDSTATGASGPLLMALTAQAALGVARSYLARGDAVSMVEFGGRDRQLRTVSGRARLPVVADWLADLQPRLNAVAEPTVPRLPPGTGRDLVLAVTALVDERTATGLIRLRQRGIAVAVLATLPVGGLRLNDGADPVEVLAAQLWSLDRDRLLHRLARLGVPVAAWDESGGLDLALRALTRAARAPRLAVR